MTNPITQQASMAAADMQAKQADARDKARINNENKDSTAEARAPAEAPKRSNDDVLSLSATAQSAMKEPGFDSGQGRRDQGGDTRWQLPTQCQAHCREFCSH